MCLDCRDIAHDSRVCAYDPSLNEVLLVAQQKHWQRCFSCHTLVEKIEGCRHMKCVCKAEFWYFSVHSLIFLFQSWNCAYTQI